MISDMAIHERDIDKPVVTDFAWGTLADERRMSVHILCIQIRCHAQLTGNFDLRQLSASVCNGRIPCFSYAETLILLRHLNI